MEGAKDPKSPNHLHALRNLQSKHDLSKQQRGKAAEVMIGLKEFTGRTRISLQQTSSYGIWDTRITGQVYIRQIRD